MVSSKITSLREVIRYRIQHRIILLIDNIDLVNESVSRVGVHSTGKLVGIPTLVFVPLMTALQYGGSLVKQVDQLKGKERGNG